MAAAWLSGWNKRIKVTASNTNIDSDLTHFPLLLTLGTSVGTGSDDVSAVFDELTSDANRKKIAVTKSDGTTECYVEIEKWDDANEKAVLWVSKSDLVLSSSATTDLYLYYDSSHADNTTYVGDVGSRTEVWDSNFKAVYHMAEDPSGTAPQILDSTSNNHDGTTGGSMTTSDLVAASIGDGLDFDGSDDYIDIGEGGGDFDLTSAWTIDAWTIRDTFTNSNIISKRGASNPNFWLINADDLAGGFYNGGWRNLILADAGMTTGVWYRIVFRWDGTYLKLYHSGVLKGTSSDFSATPPLANNDNVIIAKYSTYFYDGILDEIRISNTSRSAAWIKADYYSTDDNLVSWGSEETPTTTYTQTTQAKGRVKQPDQVETTQAKGRIKQTILKSVQSKGRIKSTDQVQVISASGKVLKPGIAQTTQAKGRVKQPDQAQTTQAKGRIKQADLSRAIQTKSRLKQTDQATSVKAKSRIKQSDVVRTIQAKSRIKKPSAEEVIKSKGRVRQSGILKTITAKSKILTSNITKAISSKSYIVDIGKTTLVSPADTSSTISPVVFQWTIPTNRWSDPMSFEIQIDKTDNSFGDIEEDKFSYRDTGFEYYNGSSWNSVPTTGVLASYSGNAIRYSTSLTTGQKYWRVRAFVG